MKALLVVFSILFVSSFAYATDYIGLYADAGHSVCTWSGGNFTLYVFSWTPDHQMNGIEFKLEFPSSCTPGSWAIGRSDDLTIPGSPFWYSDFSIATSLCANDWTLAGSCPITYTGGVGIIYLEDPDPGNGIYMAISDCDYDMWNLTVANHMYLEQQCIKVGTKDSTWGAIKSLF